MARLWNYFGGEPYLDNPHLAIVGNPKKKSSQKGNRKMATAAGRKKMNWVRSFKKNKARSVRRTNRPRKKTHRKNPWPVAGVVVNPPKPRRRPAFKMNHKRRHYRRNPMELFGMTLPPVQSIMFATGGYLGTPYVEGLINSYATSLASTTMGSFAVKLAALLGLTLVAKNVAGNEAGQMVAVGGSIYVIQCAVNNFSPGLLPTITLQGYTGAAARSRTGIGRVGKVRAYIPANQQVNPRMGNYRQATFPGASARNTVPTRFNRF
jgi:hypothetical protein